MFFEHARFSFPDLATGGPGCCNQITSTDDQSAALRISFTKPIGVFGLEYGGAYLGTMKTAFDVSGPFGTALQMPAISGRCVESGRFDFASAFLLGTYDFQIFGVTVTPKAGMSLIMSDINTGSHCNFVFASGPQSVNRHQDKTRFNLSPTLGVSAKAGIFVLSVEQSRARLGYTHESRDYGQTHVKLNSFWIGIQHGF